MNASLAVPLRAARHVFGRLMHRMRSQPISTEYCVLGGGSSDALRNGWRDPAIVRRQQRAFDPLLDRLRQGAPRQDFVALADAVRATGAIAPSVVEVGCASGWNAEVLECLVGGPIQYVGIDYSLAMVKAATRRYPHARFGAGDAARLPLVDGACDIVISGTVLMHVPDYAAAIRECGRVSRRWVVFHTVPLLRRRPTTILSKRAYGVRVVEVIFNQDELLDRFRSAGFAVRCQIESVPYDLAPIVGEPTASCTFLCEKERSS